MVVIVEVIDGNGSGGFLPFRAGERTNDFMKSTVIEL